MIHNVSRSSSVMEIQASFDVLSAAIDGYESHGLAVETVDATTDDGEDGSVRATMEVVVSPADLLVTDEEGSDGAFAPEAAVVTEAGDIRVDLPAGDRLCRPALRAGVASVTVDAARVTPDGVG